jgi:hypothetical protein
MGVSGDGIDVGSLNMELSGDGTSVGSPNMEVSGDGTDVGSPIWKCPEMALMLTPQYGSVRKWH